MRPYAMLYRLLTFNILIAAWLVYTDYSNHWFRAMVQADTTRLSILIIVLFCIIALSLFNAAWRTERDIKAVDGFDHYVPAPPHGGKWRLDEIEHIGKAGGWMFTIGLIGTILGLSISLSGVNAGAFNDIIGIKSVAIQMITGLKIELGVTVIGAVFGLWTEISYYILKHTVSRLAHREG